MMCLHPQLPAPALAPLLYSQSQIPALALSPPLYLQLPLHTGDRLVRNTAGHNVVEEAQVRVHVEG